MTNQTNRKYIENQTNTKDGKTKIVTERETETHLLGSYIYRKRKTEKTTSHIDNNVRKRDALLQINYG